ncbi:MAG: hypothetical protein JWM72_1548 [Actinomycetia bacterium]|nr:hypothetical protein [Actinomycetes bacterium]
MPMLTNRRQPRKRRFSSSIVHAAGPTPVHDTQIGASVGPVAKLAPLPARFGAFENRSG